MVLWGRSILGRHKVPPRFHQDYIFGLLGPIPFVPKKGCAERFAMTSLHLCPSSFNFFWHFSPAVLQEMDFASHRFPGVFPKLFRKFRLRVSRVFLGLNGWCFRKKFGGGFPHYSLHLSPKWLLLDKKFFGGCSQLCLAFVSQFLPEVKVAWVDDVSQPYKSSPQKTTNHVFAVGVFFGLMAAFGGFPPTAFWKGHEARIFQWSVGATRCSSTVHEEHMELVKGPVLTVARDGIWLCGTGRIPRHTSTWSCYDPQHFLSWLSL